MLPVALLSILLIHIKVKDATILVVGLFLLMAACIIKINYHYADAQNQYQYYAGSVLLISAMELVEPALMAIVAKTIPPHLAFSYWNAGMLTSVADSSGRLLGSAAFTVYSMFDSTFLRAAQPFYAYIVNSIVVTLLFIGAVVMYPRFDKHMEIEVIID